MPMRPSQAITPLAVAQPRSLGLCRSIGANTNGSWLTRSTEPCFLSGGSKQGIQTMGSSAPSQRTEVPHCFQTAQVNVHIPTASPLTCTHKRRVFVRQEQCISLLLPLQSTKRLVIYSYELRKGRYSVRIPPPRGGNNKGLQKSRKK